MTRVLIIYDSKTGNTESTANLKEKSEQHSHLQVEQLQEPKQQFFPYCKDY